MDLEISCLVLISQVCSLPFSSGSFFKQMVPAYFCSFYVILFIYVFSDKINAFILA